MLDRECRPLPNHVGTLWGVVHLLMSLYKVTCVLMCRRQWRCSEHWIWLVAIPVARHKIC